MRSEIYPVWSRMVSVVDLLPPPPPPQKKKKLPFRAGVFKTVDCDQPDSHQNVFLFQHETKLKWCHCCNLPTRLFIKVVAIDQLQWWHHQRSPFDLLTWADSLFLLLRSLDFAPKRWRRALWHHCSSHNRAKCRARPKVDATIFRQEDIYPWRYRKDKRGLAEQSVEQLGALPTMISPDPNVNTCPKLIPDRR